MDCEIKFIEYNIMKMVSLLSDLLLRVFSGI